MDNIKHCEVCSIDFSISGWKKNCEFCGKKCCKKCIVDNNRICEDCLFAQSTRQALSLQEDLNVKDSINNLLKDELKNKITQVERFRQFLLEFDSLFVKDVVSDRTHLLMRMDFTDIENDMDQVIEKSVNNIRVVADELKSLYDARESTVSLISQLNDKIRELEFQNSELKNQIPNSDSQNFDMSDDFEVGILREQLETYKTRCEALEMQLLSKERLESRSNTGIYLTAHNPHQRSKWWCLRCPLFS